MLKAAELANFITVFISSVTELIDKKICTDLGEIEDELRIKKILTHYTTINSCLRIIIAKSHVIWCGYKLNKSGKKYKNALSSFLDNVNSVKDPLMYFSQIYDKPGRGKGKIQSFADAVLQITKYSGIFEREIQTQAPPVTKVKVGGNEDIANVWIGDGESEHAINKHISKYQLLKDSYTGGKYGGKTQKEYYETVACPMAAEIFSKPELDKSLVLQKPRLAAAIKPFNIPVKENQDILFYYESVLTGLEEAKHKLITQLVKESIGSFNNINNIHTINEAQDIVLALIEDADKLHRQQQNSPFTMLLQNILSDIRQARKLRSNNGFQHEFDKKAVSDLGELLDVLEAHIKTERALLKDTVCLEKKYNKIANSINDLIAALESFDKSFYSVIMKILLQTDILQHVLQRRFESTPESRELLNKLQAITVTKSIPRAQIYKGGLEISKLKDLANRCLSEH